MPYQIARRKASGGFNIKPNKYGGYLRISRGKTQGVGVSDNVYENINNGIKNTISDFKGLKIKPTKQRKYISLNL